MVPPHQKTDSSTGPSCGRAAGAVAAPGQPAGGEQRRAEQRAEQPAPARVGAGAASGGRTAGTGSSWGPAGLAAGPFTQARARVSTSVRSALPASPVVEPRPASRSHGVLGRVELLHSGKVRDVYADGDDLILVASDRISIYDVVLPTPIPDKGELLTALSLWWFEQLADLVPNHVISATDVPAEFAGRAIRCRRLDMVPVECVARGYLTGGGLQEYERTGAVSGVPLPRGPGRGVDPARADLHPVDQGAGRASTTSRSPSTRWWTRSAPETAERAAADHPRRLPARRRDRRRAGHPGRRHQDRAGLGAGRHPGPRRRGAHLRLVAVLAGRVVPAGPRRSSPTTSSTCGTGPPAAAGTSRPPAPEVPAEVVEATRARYVEVYERLTGNRWE